jgi:hypothetical protein
MIRLSEFKRRQGAVFRGSTSLEEPVKDSNKDDAGAYDLPQGDRAQENFHLPEKIAQEIGCLGCEQAVFDHRLLASGE